jgi:hypothetical protein
MEVCIIKDTMGATQNNELEFQAPHEHHPFTCRTSSCRASLMKDDVKVMVPNGTPRTLIPSNGVENWDGVLKSGGTPPKGSP